MATGSRERGWCAYCGAACRRDRSQAGKLVCSACGSDMVPLDTISAEDRAMVEMQDWFAEVCRNGKNGPSPQDAAKSLGCHRSMVDRLVGMGVLEKSEFCFKGQKLIIISQRSLDTARENRERTGNWTGHPVRRGK